MDTRVLYYKKFESKVLDTDYIKKIALTSLNMVIVQESQQQLRNKFL